jgi:hypothetical protein
MFGGRGQAGSFLATLALTLCLRPGMFTYVRPAPPY